LQTALSLLVLFQGNFGIALQVWDDDTVTGDDFVDIVQSNIDNIPAQKDFQSASGRMITVRRLLYLLGIRASLETLQYVPFKELFRLQDWS